MVVGLLLALGGSAAVSFLSLRPKALAFVLLALIIGLSLVSAWQSGASLGWVGGAMLASLALTLGGYGLSTTRFMARALSRIVANPTLIGEDFDATAIFVDLADSTELIQARSNQEAADMLSKVLSLIIDAAHAHGVEVETTMGDGAFLVLYGDKNSRHAHDAVAAMRGIQRAAEDAGEEFDKAFNFRPRLTFGVATGKIAGRLLNTRHHFGASLHGSVVHLAARLQGACSDHKIDAIASAEFAALHPEVTRSLGIANLKGFGEVELFALDLRAAD
jgi:class 3 adenylate cyclase